MKTNPDVHIICGKCGCSTMMKYKLSEEKNDDGKKITVVYLICNNCNTLTGLDELIKQENK